MPAHPGYIYLSGMEPLSGWIHGGLQALVDASDYLGVPGPEWRWCDFECRDPEGTAGTFPYKVRIPGRGIGQYRRNEIRGWRISRVTADAMATIAEVGDEIGPWPA